ncbi:unnamed protein product [Linum tenue]|uniref:J domain-containing protein n=1 Tax=Linum tenue TaxID=586396 RepID=A0AAV0M8V5_9ROSI|nr:unnamed protein product [Linum tenue]
MECNRGEAARAKEIAEKKFFEKDLVGARKFALKAKNLYPELEGITQMVATLDVYISSENKVNGEEDWYGILGTNPLADDDMVRKQYRKLALILHPDKNKSVGADGAFKLISMAWSTLSDKTKRVAYDQNRKTNIFRKASSHYSSPVSSQKSKQPKTFWTVCHQCRMQYEYLRIYLDHNLLCPNCHEPFIATEKAPPSSNRFKLSAQANFSQQSKKSNRQASGKNTMKSSNAYEKVKREREEAQAATRREESLKRKHVSKRMGGGYAGKRRRSAEDGGLNKEKGSVTVQMVSTSRRGGSTGVVGVRKCSDMRDAAQVEIESLLLEKARTAISKKLYDLNSATVSELFMETGNDSGEEDNVFEKSVVNGDANEPCAPSDPPNSEAGLFGSTTSPTTSGAKINTEILDSMFIDVPDADFYNFDNNRTETCFGENQVWAAYGYNEGFPRYYAMIHAVISLDPLKLRISWLKSRTNSEFGPLNWFCSGFSKTCGEFQVGRREIYSSLYCFSHKVRWKSDIHGSIHIYPRKGDVWALYRNWSPDWNELTEDEVIQKYDVVEVLEDYNQELGVIVVPLVKVAGFKTVFRQHLDVGEIRRIPREEMFRFSHLVPSYILTSQEGPDCPKGCRELDPAATPIELLHVVVDVKREDLLEDESIE